MSELHISSKWPWVAGALAVLYLISLLVPAIYNALFHPLKHFPGPKLAAATPLPMGWHRLRGDQHEWLKSLHEQYGPVVRFLPDHLSFIEPQAWKDIYGHKLNGRGDMPKDTKIMTSLIGGKDSIIFMDDANHSRARRLVSHALSDKALREQQEILNTYVQKLVEKIRDVATMPEGKIDAVRWYNFTTFDVIADLAFGEPLGMLSDGEWTPWVIAINRMIPIMSTISIVGRWFPPIGLMIKLFLPAKYTEPVRTHIQYSKDQVDKRMARETNRPDFWKYILRNQGKESGSLNQAESHAMGMTLMVAGSETTATLLSGLTYHLLKNPDKQQRLVEEIRGTFSSIDEIGMDNLTHLPYLQACLEEGLRLYPPVPLGQQRVVPLGGRMVGDNFVPEGTIVMVSHWPAYRSPLSWHRPEEFLPERWLAENQKAGPFATDRREVLQPFSFGPRNCIGKNLAYHEMRLILSNVFFNFDLELAQESKQWASNQKVYGLAVKPPLIVQPKMRRS